MPDECWMILDRSGNFIEVDEADYSRWVAESWVSDDGELEGDFIVEYEFYTSKNAGSETVILETDERAGTSLVYRGGKWTGRYVVERRGRLIADFDIGDFTDKGMEERHVLLVALTVYDQIRSSYMTRRKVVKNRIGRNRPARMALLFGESKK